MFNLPSQMCGRAMQVYLSLFAENSCRNQIKESIEV